MGVGKTEAALAAAETFAGKWGCRRPVLWPAHTGHGQRYLWKTDRLVADTVGRCGPLHSAGPWYGRAERGV